MAAAVCRAGGDGGCRLRTATRWTGLTAAAASAFASAFASLPGAGSRRWGGAAAMLRRRGRSDGQRVAAGAQVRRMRPASTRPCTGCGSGAVEEATGDAGSCRAAADGTRLRETAG